MAGTPGMNATISGMEGFAAQLQYDAANGYDVETYPSTMPGALALNQAALSAVASGNEFSSAAKTGFESFKQLTRACAARYQHNDSEGATTIAGTSATIGDQISVIDRTNSGGYYDRIRHGTHKDHWTIRGDVDPHLATPPATPGN